MAYESVGDWLFDPDGWLKYPLYHGTSIYFLDSIRTYGLGGRNCIKEWRTLEMWRELRELRKQEEPIAYYKGGSWGYGEVYLTPFKSRALLHESSEAIRSIKSNLRYMKRDLRQQLLSRYPELTACIQFAHQPVLIRLSRVHHSQLMGWHDDNPLVERGNADDVQADRSGPDPTFRLRTPITDFEVIVLPVPEPFIRPRRKPDDPVWPLSYDQWIIEFLQWATIPATSKSDVFWKVYLEQTVDYVSNSDVSRAFRELGYVFPDGYRRDQQSGQRVRWKWRSPQHKEYLNALIDKSRNLTKFANIAAQLEQIKIRAHEH